MRYYNDVLIYDETVNNTTVNGEGFSVEDMNGYAVQAVWTGGSANGLVKLQASVDGTVYADIYMSEVAISGPGDQLWNIADVYYKWLRVSCSSVDTNDIVITARIYSKGNLP